MTTLSPPRPIATRRSRFKRAEAAPLRLTDDDLAIVRQVARHRFLRSTHLIALMPHRSPKKLLERLAELYHNGFLDRPRAQLDYFATAGSAPIVYALGPRGALLLANRDGLNRAAVDWTWKNRSVGRLYIDHTLLIADVLVGIERAARLHAGVKTMQEHEILTRAPETTRRAANPLKLSARTTYGGKSVDTAVIPDALFGLDYTAERKRKYFLLEADCATMPIVRAGLNQTSYARKLLAYLAGGGTHNVFGVHFGIGNFRLLTVTTSAERMATMIAALKELTHGAGSQQFLFIDHASLLASRDLLALPWMTGKGTFVCLLD